VSIYNVTNIRATRTKIFSDLYLQKIEMNFYVYFSEQSFIKSLYFATLPQQSFFGKAACIKTIEEIA
jgi:hypothetical protein